MCVESRKMVLTPPKLKSNSRIFFYIELVDMNWILQRQRYVTMRITIYRCPPSSMVSIWQCFTCMRSACLSWSIQHLVSSSFVFTLSLFAQEVWGGSFYFHPFYCQFTVHLLENMPYWWSLLDHEVCKAGGGLRESIFMEQLGPKRVVHKVCTALLL